MSARRKEYSICLLRKSSDASLAFSPNAARRCSSMRNGSINVPYTSKARTGLGRSLVIENPRAASIMGLGPRGNREIRLRHISEGREGVSHSAHVQPKLLAASRGLLSANRGWLGTSRGQEKLKTLDAARIRTNPNDLPGPGAGIRAGRDRAAFNGFFQARIAAAAPHIHFKQASSFPAGRASLPSTPRTETSLHAGNHTHSGPSFRNNIGRSAAASLPSTGRAENPSPVVAQDSRLAGDR